jgi:hypothetical protein
MARVHDHRSFDNSVLLFNANSIFRMSSALRQSLQAMSRVPILICVTESKLKEGGYDAPDLSGFGYNKPLNYIRPQGADCKIASGGVTVYVRSDIGHQRRQDLEQKEVEVVWLEIWKPGLLRFYPGDRLLLGVLYRTPSPFQGRSQQDQWRMIEKNIMNALHQHEDNGPVLVLADWNLKSLEEVAPNAFDQMIDECNITVLAPPNGQVTLVNAPAGSGANDFGICSVDQVISDVEVARIGLTSNHFPVIFHLIEGNADEEKEEIRRVWNREGDWERFREELGPKLQVIEAKLISAERCTERKEVQWDQIASDINVALTSTAESVVGKRTTTRAYQTWSKQQHVRDAFQQLKDSESALIDHPEDATLLEQLNNAKQQFNLIRNAAQEKAWNAIRERVGTDQSRKLVQVLLPQDTSNINLVDICDEKGAGCTKEQAVEVMAEHYAEVCSLPDNPSFDAAKKKEVEEAISNICAERRMPDRSIEITAKTVTEICRKLSRHSAAGPDDVAPSFLIEGGSRLHALLARFFNDLLRSGYAPASFRVASIFPIYKGEGNPRSLPISYRPISLTSVIAKLMERCLLPYLQSCIAPFLNVNQAGFRPGYSAIDQIYRLSRAIQKVLAERSERPNSAKAHSVLPVAFLDISKAFDRVWIDGLLFKAWNCNVKGQLWWWLKSYLSNRSIQVSSHGITSALRAISAGVPQGCVLSPTLFLIFINDCVEHLNGCRIGLYADDIALWPILPVSKKGDLGKIHLQNALLQLTDWSSKWRMTFNVKKSCVVLFGAKSRSSTQYNDLTSELVFQLCNQSLPQRRSFCYLGVVFQEDGKWHEHFDKLLVKVRYAINRICRIIRRGQYPTLPVICELIKTQVQSIISYSFPVVRFNETQMKALDRLLILPVKRSLSVFKTTSHASLFVESRLLDVSGLWAKSVISYSHRLLKHQDHAAFFQFEYDLAEFDDDMIPATSPDYVQSFAARLRGIEKIMHIKHNEHFESRQLKDAVAADMMKRMLAHDPHALFLQGFAVEEEPTRRVDHYLRADPPAVIALRARVRLGSTAVNVNMNKMKIVNNPACPHCHAVETIQHVILHCPHYGAARFTLESAFAFKPPDDFVMDLCLGRTQDHVKKGRKRTFYEKISGNFLLDIDRLRPKL